MKKVTLLLILLCLTGWDSQSGVISFTFDDGKKSVFSVAYPLFNVHNIPGSVAVITEPIQKGNDNFLSISQLHKLQNAGWEIMSHSITHPRFPLNCIEILH